jgi:hypothetical protein
MHWGVVDLGRSVGELLYRVEFHTLAEAAWRSGASAETVEILRIFLQDLAFDQTANGRERRHAICVSEKAGLEPRILGTPDTECSDDCSTCPVGIS